LPDSGVSSAQIAGSSTPKGGSHGGVGSQGLVADSDRAE
jgi:hypothetical protein